MNCLSWAAGSLSRVSDDGCLFWIDRPPAIHMPHLPTPHNPRDPAHAVQVMLRGTRGRSALAPLEWPSEEGVFPAASFLRKPRPVVGDTRCLAEVIAYACRENRRTVLVTAANEQIIRLFCSAHVVAYARSGRPNLDSSSRPAPDSYLATGKRRLGRATSESDLDAATRTA